MVDAQVTEHMGRRSLAGTAVLKDAAFENGVIEVDMACSGARSYPGVVFRIQRPGESERVYLRPHRAGPSGYPDAVQYVPAFNGVDSWQLYNGNGFTASASIATGEWFHVKIEVMGTQARVFIGEGDQPALRIHDLKHGLSKGTLGLNGPKDGSAFFSNFSYRTDDGLKFDPPPGVDTPPGLVTEWQLSQPFKAWTVDRDKDPAAQNLPGLTWKAVTSDTSGLVDISRTYGRLGPGPDCVLAKTVIKAERDETKKFRFGYSDEITIFLNGKPLFCGDSTYRFRDPSFLGIVGPFDAVYLPLKKGDNPLLFVITENMGGWGFLCQDANAIFEAPGVKEAWRTPAQFAMPETVAYDPARKVLYVSSYDGFNPSRGEGKQAIARVSLDGKTVDLQWVAGLKNHAGLAVSGDRLYALEATDLVEVDIPSAKLATRTPVPGAMFLNDLAVAPDGAIYLSDSGTSVIFRVMGGKIEAWLKGPEIGRPNGLQINGGELLVGNNADGCLKAVDLSTKAIRTVAALGAGIIDGIEREPDGKLLVSHNEGRLFRISQSGGVTKLLDTSVPGRPMANFALVPEKGLVVIPTWTDNRVVAYTLPKP
jgi:sugar lactone lactonase YvrE